MGYDIYFRDLSPQAQAAFLEYFDMRDPKEGNFDVLPITTIEEPVQEMSELKLYSPLKIYMDTGEMPEDIQYDYEAPLPELSPYEAAGYEDEISAHFVKELSSDWREIRYGLMAYYHENDEVKKKVISICITTEVVDGQLMGVATLTMSEPLTRQGLERVKDYLAGQYSDGYGEGAEQRPVKTDYGDLYVSLWNSDGNFKIQTELEMAKPSKIRGDAR